jgi:hypothetical protein
MHGTCIEITFIMSSILVAFAKRVLERHCCHHIDLTRNTNDTLREVHKYCSDAASVLLVRYERYKSHKDFLFTSFHQKTLSSFECELSKLHNILQRIPDAISHKMEQFEMKRKVEGKQDVAAKSVRV